MKLRPTKRERYWVDIRPQGRGLVDVHFIDASTLQVVGSAVGITVRALSRAIAEMRAGGLRVVAEGFGPPPPLVNGRAN